MPHCNRAGDYLQAGSPLVIPAFAGMTSRETTASAQKNPDAPHERMHRDEQHGAAALGRV